MPMTVWKIDSTTTSSSYSIKTLLKIKYPWRKRTLIELESSSRRQSLFTNGDDKEEEEKEEEFAQWFGKFVKRRREE